MQVKNSLTAELWTIMGGESTRVNAMLHVGNYIEAFMNFISDI